MDTVCNVSSDVKDPDHRKPENNNEHLVGNKMSKTATETQCFHENKLMHLLNKMSTDF